jgi:poly-gamma-glutamate synthesis protein (capsule biosynthesis protein)
MGPPLRLFLCGDVMTGRGIDQILPSPGDPQLYERWVASAEDYVRLAERVNGPIPRPAAFEYVWGDALPAWAAQKPDLRIVNLETSVTTSDDYLAKGINYRMHPGNAPCLAAAGVDACVLANNHVLDWGERGLRETLQVLRELGLVYAGAGRDAAEAAAPVVLSTATGARVILVAGCTGSSGVPEAWAAGPDRPGVNRVEPGEAAAERLAAALAAVRQPGDLAVVSIHWGGNWGYEVPPAHRRFAHALVERAGAAVVHGHSSHHPMAMEVHAGRLILYGCGDFLNDYEGISGHESYRPDLALMYFADLDPETGALVALRMTPLQLCGLRLRAATKADTAWLQARLDRECARFGAGVVRADGGLALAWRP